MNTTRCASFADYRDIMGTPAASTRRKDINNYCNGKWAGLDRSFKATQDIMKWKRAEDLSIRCEGTSSVIHLVKCRRHYAYENSAMCCPRLLPLLKSATKYTGDISTSKRHMLYLQRNSCIRSRTVPNDLHILERRRYIVIPFVDQWLLNTVLRIQTL